MARCQTPELMRQHRLVKPLHSHSSVDAGRQLGREGASWVTDTYRSWNQSLCFWLWEYQCLSWPGSSLYPSLRKIPKGRLFQNSFWPTGMQKWPRTKQPRTCTPSLPGCPAQGCGVPSVTLVGLVWGAHRHPLWLPHICKRVLELASAPGERLPACTGTSRGTSLHFISKM